MNSKRAPNPISEVERRLAGLMSRTQKGESAACHELLVQVEKVISPYFNKALSRVGIAPVGRAEDLIQETLLAIFNKRHTFQDGQLFLPWLFAIARYKLIDNLRTTKGVRQPVALSEIREPIAPEPSTAALDVEALLSALPKKQRLLLGLVKGEGLTSEEAAAQTGFSVSDVKVSLHRAIKKLKKKVGGS